LKTYLCTAYIRSISIPWRPQFYGTNVLASRAPTEFINQTSSYTDKVFKKKFLTLTKRNNDYCSVSLAQGCAVKTDHRRLLILQQGVKRD
jgi:hypothetical protein